MAWNLNTLALLVPLLFLLTGLSITVAIDPYISREHRRVMGIIIALSVTLIVQNVWEDYIAAGPPRWFLRTTLAVYGYTLRPVFLILFLYIVQPGKKYLACWTLAILNWAVNMTAFFSHLCFWIDENNHYQGGPLHAVAYVVSAILMGIWLFQSVRDYRTSQKRDQIIPIFVVLMISVSVFLDKQAGKMEQPITFLTFAIVICSVFYYIWLHLKFVRDHEDAMMMEQRVQIMLSQIQPHFLYNSLTVIQDLCRTDPEQAEAATIQFARYLRGNMDSLQTSAPVPFAQELEHTREYLALEKMRFEDKLTVRYDIQCESFALPTLTLQPIVENAVRHGVRGNRDGAGEVSISTREHADRYEVTVSDNGPGFDPSMPPKEDRTHVGVRNVRERLAQMCGGTLTVDSAPGKGTTVSITLPKEAKET